MTDCANAAVRDDLPDLLHGTLDPSRRAVVAAHVAACTACAAELRLLRAARVTLHRAPAVDVARIVAALPAPPTRPRLVREDARDGGERILPPPRRMAAWRRRAIAAATLLAVGGGAAVLAGRGPASAPDVAVGSRAPARARGDAGGPSAAEPSPRAPVTGGGAGEGTGSTSAVAVARAEPLLAVSTIALTDADLEGLIDELDELEAVPSAEPFTLVPVPVGESGGSGL